MNSWILSGFVLYLGFASSILSKSEPIVMVSSAEMSAEPTKETTTVLSVPLNPATAKTKAPIIIPILRQEENDTISSSGSAIESVTAVSHPNAIPFNDSSTCTKSMVRHDTFLVHYSWHIDGIASYVALAEQFGKTFDIRAGPIKLRTDILSGEWMFHLMKEPLNSIALRVLYTNKTDIAGNSLSFVMNVQAISGAFKSTMATVQSPNKSLTYYPEFQMYYDPFDFHRFSWNATQAIANVSNASGVDEIELKFDISCFVLYKPETLSKHCF